MNNIHDTSHVDPGSKYSSSYNIRCLSIKPSLEAYFSLCQENRIDVPRNTVVVIVSQLTSQDLTLYIAGVVYHSLLLGLKASLRMLTSLFNSISHVYSPLAIQSTRS
jgi:hypothetical protein